MRIRNLPSPVPRRVPEANASQVLQARVMPSRFQRLHEQARVWQGLPPIVEVDYVARSAYIEIPSENAWEESALHRDQHDDGRGEGNHDIGEHLIVESAGRKVFIERASSLRKFGRGFFVKRGHSLLHLLILNTSRG